MKCLKGCLLKEENTIGWRKLILEEDPYGRIICDLSPFASFHLIPFSCFLSEMVGLIHNCRQLSFANVIAGKNYVYTIFFNFILMHFMRFWQECLGNPLLDICKYCKRTITVFSFKRILHVQEKLMTLIKMVRTL